MTDENTTDNSTTDNSTIDDSGAEAELQALLLAEVPEATPHYWAGIDELVDQAAQEHGTHLSDASAATGPAGSLSSVTDISIECRTGLDEPKPTFLSRLGWPAAIAASLLLLVGLVAVVGNRRSANTNDVATGIEERLRTETQPLQNYDHWHSVYGVWDCTLADGAGDWVPHFASNQDVSGIHSHNDGVIHIHPFHEWSAGENAQLGLFTTEMQVELSDDAMVLDDGRELREGVTTCNGEPATLHLRHWDFDFQAETGEAPQIITENLASARFENDREAWVIAFAPLDAELPMIPQERFDTLNNVTGTVDYEPQPPTYYQEQQPPYS